MRISDWSSDVCSSDLARHAEVISAQLSQCGAPADALILEPAARNTAPAIALAAALAAQTEPDALLLVMPSDQVIGDVEAFHRAVRQALPVAAAGWLVTFGIRPAGPQTGHGDIEIGAAPNGRASWGERGRMSG